MSKKYLSVLLIVEVDTESGAGFGTGLDVYLRTTSRRGRDGLMSSLSGAEPGMPEATPHHPRTVPRGLWRRL